MPFNAGGPVTDYKCEVGEGWHPLLDELHEELVKADPEYQTFQVKEKFGLLRVYLSGHSEAVQELLWAFEKKSGAICEACGSPGRLRNDRYWVKTLCDEHAARGQY